jgi:hypothetical protein
VIIKLTINSCKSQSRQFFLYSAAIVILKFVNGYSWKFNFINIKVITKRFYINHEIN